ncbi:MAG: ApaG protein [Planctomycetota bacterium]|jgi:ApaG protein|uniref:Co2+/Mg2+ efflux protein ApaG n=1 Tax=Patiriisocius sp. Uisw_047 TaxID=3230969 RepID=UPI0039EBFEDE
MMYEVTQGIKVSVKTRFEGKVVDQGLPCNAFSYLVKIENNSEYVVQLKKRYWAIKDSLNETEFVYGDGVVGKRPVLKPGESHVYSSGCLLKGDFGEMGGYYEMVNFSTTEIFKVTIPNFKLVAPQGVN